MVLNQRNPALLLLAGLAGCLARQPIVQAPQPVPVAVATVLGGVESKDLLEVPDDFQDRIDHVVSARNLVARPLEPSRFKAAFTDSRSTAHRLLWLDGAAGDAGLLLLVEAEARYFSQLNGQYRWTVEVHATLAPPHQPEAATTADFEVPVFLQFHHERETEALSAAAPVIERRVGSLIDEYLAGQRAAPRGG